MSLWSAVASECRKRGHDIQTIDGRVQNLVYQKGDARQVLDYYDGMYYFCKRRGCEWSQYIGSTQPYRREVVNGSGIENQSSAA